jgi:hypothetical protein
MENTQLVSDKSKESPEDRKFKSEHGLNKNHLAWVKREESKGHNRFDIVPTLKYYLENKGKFPKALFDYDATELENLIKEGTISNNDKKKASRGKHAILKEDDRFILVRVDDQDAASFWGLGTKWCITMDNTQHFDSYRSSGNVVFYICIDKKAKEKELHGKVCIVIYRDKDNKHTKIECYLSNDKLCAKTKLKKEMLEFLD